MKQMKIIKCSECEWLGTESFTELKFIEHADPNDIFDPINFLNVYSEGLGIKICKHPICFEYHEKNDPVNGITKYRSRISGRGILNCNNNCKYFKPNLLTKILNYFRKKI